jgi:hypothetical protein
MRAAFKKCPRIVFFEHVAGIKPKESGINALVIGSAFHRGLELWRTHLDIDRAIAQATAEFAASLRSNEIPDDSITVETGRLKAYLAGYARHFSDDSRMGWESEVNIKIEGETGTVDALMTDPQTGEVWVLEDKTRTQLTDNLHYVLRMNEQMLSYASLLNSIGRKFAGFIYRETKKTQTRQTQKETAEQYAQRVFEIYTSETASSNFVEERVIFSPNEIAKYEVEKSHMNFVIENCLIQMHDFERWGWNSDSCVGKYGACKYLQICATKNDMIGRQYQPTENEPLDGGLFRKEIWGTNIVKSNEQVLNIELPN